MQKVIKQILIAFLFSIVLTSCISTKVEEINPQDYGILDFPQDIKIYKSSSEGKIDSTHYYSETNYNSLLNTSTTTINKTGAAQLTSKPDIIKKCLSSACEKSTQLGFEYILVLNENENTYEKGYYIYYSYQIVFVPLNKDDITPELPQNAIFKNTLYFNPEDYSSDGLN